MLLVYALTTTWLGLRWAEQRNVARTEATRSETVTGYLEALLSEADPRVAGEGDLSALELVRRAPQRLDRRISEDPMVESTIRLLVGRVLVNLGDEVAGNTEIESVLDRLESTASDDWTAEHDALAVEAHLAMASSLVRARREQDALDLLADLEQHIDRTPGTELRRRTLRGRLNNRRANALSSSGRRVEAVGVARVAVAELENTDAAGERHRLAARRTLANVLRLTGAEDALERLRESYRDYVDYYGADHPAVLSPLRGLAGAVGSRGFETRASDPEGSKRDLAEVQTLLDRGVDISSRHYGNDRRYVADFLRLRGALAYAREEWQQVADDYGAAREIHLERDITRTEAANDLMFMGIATMELGNLEEAVAQLEQAHLESIEGFGPEHGKTASVAFNLGRALSRQRSYASAIEHLSTALEVYREYRSGDRPQTRETATLLADAHVLWVEDSTSMTDSEAGEHLERARELYESLALEEGDRRWDRLRTLEEARAAN